MEPTQRMTTLSLAIPSIDPLPQLKSISGSIRDNLNMVALDQPEPLQVGGLLVAAEYV